MGCSASVPNKKIQDPKQIEQLARDTKQNQSHSPQPQETKQDKNLDQKYPEPTTSPKFSKKFLVPNHARLDVNSDASIIESSVRKARLKSPDSSKKLTTSDSYIKDSPERVSRSMSRNESPKRSQIATSIEKVPETMKNFPVKVSSASISPKSTGKRAKDEKETRKLFYFVPLVAFPNFSNNSAINSALQCLLNLESFLKIISDSVAENNKPGSFFNFFYNISLDLNEKNALDYLKNFKQELTKLYSKYSDNVETDPYDLVKDIFDAIGSEIMDKRANSFLQVPEDATIRLHAKLFNEHISAQKNILLDKFGATLLKITSCLKCKEPYFDFSKPFILSLPIPKVKLTLEQSLDVFTRPKLIPNFKCNKCKSEGYAQRTTFIWQCPEVLVFRLNKFKKDENNEEVENKKPLVFPLEKLSLNPFLHEFSSGKMASHELN